MLINGVLDRKYKKLTFYQRTNVLKCEKQTDESSDSDDGLVETMPKMFKKNLLKKLKHKMKVKEILSHFENKYVKDEVGSRILKGVLGNDIPHSPKRVSRKASVANDYKPTDHEMSHIEILQLSNVT